MSSGSAGKLAWCAGITAAESAYIRVYMDGWVRARSLMRSCVRRACAFACACPPQHHHTTTLQVHAPYVPLHAPPPLLTAMVRTGSTSFVLVRVAIFEICAVRLSLILALALSMLSRRMSSARASSSA